MLDDIFQNCYKICCVQNTSFEKEISILSHIAKKVTDPSLFERLL